jgi:hypothetical protein
MKRFALLIPLIAFFYTSSSQNQPPVAVSDTFLLDNNPFYPNVYLRVRDNDYDLDGGGIRIDTVFYSGNGIATFNALRIQYQPPPDGYFGKDSLSYVIRDTDEPFLYDTAEVQITVKKVPFEIIEANEIRVAIWNDGELFTNNFIEEGFYEVPKNGGNSTFYSFSPWLIGLSSAGIKMNANQFIIGPFENSAAGPIMDSEYYLSYDETWDRVWKVSRAQIWYHLEHYTDPGYTPIEVIRNWPAHGDTEKGQAEYLAPFVDSNEDGHYNPMDGDYPQIKGDWAIYRLYNFMRPYWLYEVLGDEEPNPIDLESTLKSEIHTMVYSFSCPNDEALENTLFAQIEFRSYDEETLHDTYLGYYSDMDIGFAIDDYVECDVSRNSMFGFNGDSFDEPSSSSPGYGSNIPTQSVTILKGAKMDEDGLDNAYGIAEGESINGLNFGDGIADNEYWGMTSFIYVVNNSGPAGDPQTTEEYYGYLQGIWKDGTPLSHGGSGYDPDNPDAIPTRFMFPNDSDPNHYGTGGIEVPIWNEFNDMNPVDDRRGIGASGPFTLEPYGTVSFELAFVTGWDEWINGQSPVENVRERIDAIKGYYLNQQTPCGDFAVGIEEQENRVALELKAWPNPFSHYIQIQNPHTKVINLQIYSQLGQVLKQVQLQPGVNTLDLSDLEGTFFIAQTTDPEINQSIKLIRLR